MATVSSSVAPLLSVTTNLNKYTPFIRLVTGVEAAFGLAMPNNGGPLTFDQTNEVIFPSASEDAVPLSVTEFVGSVIVWSPPAFAIGGTFGGGGAAFTVIMTVSSSVAPLLSVTTILNAYMP